MDWDLRLEMLRCSDGVLRWDPERRLLTYRDEQGVCSVVVVSEAELRNWLQIVLLATGAAPGADLSHERAIRELARRAREHAAAGQDPFTGLRDRVRLPDAPCSLAG